MADMETRVEQIVESVLDMDPDSPGFRAESFDVRMKQAKVGMTFSRNRNQNDRIKQGQRLRMIGMISRDPEMRKQYIQATKPGELPDLRDRPKKK